MEGRRTLTQYPSLAATARSSVNPGLALLCCWRRSSVVNTAQPVSNTKRIVSIMWHYSIQMEMTQKLTENRLRSVVMIAMTGSVVMVVISGQCFPMASLLMIRLVNGTAMHARSKSAER